MSRIKIIATFLSLNVFVLQVFAQGGDVIGDKTNQANGSASFVGGGSLNKASGKSSFVGGGSLNKAIGISSFVGGGQDNEASGNVSFVGGGQDNKASGNVSFVGGGSLNKAIGISSFVGGGSLNKASGGKSFVGGGGDNEASGYASFVGGGSLNKASALSSFVGGSGGNVNKEHAGTILFSSFEMNNIKELIPFYSVASGEFAVRATGGVRFVTAIEKLSGEPSSGSYLASGSGSWSSMSSKEQKENFETIDSQEILNKVISMPVQKWNYKSQDDSVKHIGPFAEDFEQAFGVGDFKGRITSTDADGVALAAIQGLNEKLQQELVGKQQEIDSLNKRLEHLEKIVMSMGKPQ
jgi:trimeric autotransporter adhesin